MSSILKHIFAVPLLCSLACDTGDESFAGHVSVCSSPDFREQGPPEILVLKTIDEQKIVRQTFADLILSPAGQDDPPLTCTLSWYQPDISKPEYTTGLGCSARMPTKLWDSYVSTFIKNGATPP